MAQISKYFNKVNFSIFSGVVVVASTLITMFGMVGFWDFIAIIILIILLIAITIAINEKKIKERNKFIKWTFFAVTALGGIILIKYLNSKSCKKQ